MSDTFKSLLTQVTSVAKKEDSDRLFHVSVLGWTLLASGVDGPNGEILPPYKVGDTVIYLEPDTLMDKKLISFAFPQGMAGKIKPDSLEVHRLRTIKLRGSYSQGMLLNPAQMMDLYPKLKNAQLGDDVKGILGTTKYEPPASSLPNGMNVKALGKKNPHFKEYTDLNNIKYYPSVFEGKKVFITEKIHGSSARFGMLPTHIGPVIKHKLTRGKWYDIIDFSNVKKHILKRLGLLPTHEFLIGSRRVQISNSNRKNNYYKDTVGDIWTRIAKDLDLGAKLQPGEELFGEIFGSGIQANYTYGCKPGEIKFMAYDVMKDGQFLSPEEFLAWCYERGVDHVPVLNKEGKAIDCAILKTCGPVFHDFSHELIDKLKAGDSTVGNQKIREGVVVKPDVETNHPNVGRLALKVISEAYLAQKGNTDFH